MAQNVKLNIPNISCGHCVNTIKRETKDVPGVLSVDADAQSKTATFVVENESVLPQLKQTLAEIGYPAAQ
jgi:copper chaperone